MKDVVSIRRELHRHPEAGFTEFYTTSYIAQELQGLGWTLHSGPGLYESERLGVPEQAVLDLAKARAREAGAEPRLLDQMDGGYTGLIAVLERGKGKTLTLRFDIDCVEVGEANPLPWRSPFEGLMHACGHDGHTAVGLHVARQLAGSVWQGRVNLVFQPAEEGVRGGRVLSKSRLLDGTDYFVSGHLGIRNDASDTLYTNVSGAMNTSKWDIRIQGEAVHAALYPEQGVSALVAASDFVMQAWRYAQEAGPGARLNIGTLKAGTGRNVVAGEALLKAETRGDTKPLNQAMGRKLKQLGEAIAIDHGVRVTVELAGEAIYAPPSPDLIRRAGLHAASAGLLLEEAPIPLSGSEDAFFYIDRVRREGGQGIYLIFGTALSAPHHHPAFDFNEAILSKMVRYYADLSLDLLR